MATAANPTRDDFAKMLDEQLGGADDGGFEGRVVKGTVTAIENGMAHIDVGVGQWVLTGEPVAVMERNGIDKPLLYLEIRRNSQPINPLSWLMTRKGKISG